MVKKKGDLEQSITNDSGLPSAKNSNNETNTLLKEIKEQLLSINQNTMDTVAATESNSSGINRLIKASEEQKSLPVTSSSNGSANIDTLKQEKASLQLASAKEKAARDAQLQSIRLQQAAFTLERSKELAKQQDEERAKRLEKEAEAELKRDREEAGKYGPVAAMGRGVSAVANAQSGVISKSLTAALTGGFGNLIGLDKLVSAAGSGLGKVASNIIGSPFQKMAKAREQKKADQQAIDNAVHAAELNERINAALRAKGFGESESVGKKKTEDKQAVDESAKSFLSSKDDNKKKGTGATKGATAENPAKGIEDRLDKIDASLKGMSKTEQKKEEKEDGNFLSMLGSIVGKLGGFLMSNLPAILAVMGAAWVGNKLKQMWDGFTSLSVKLGQKILENGKSLWNGLKSFGSKAASGIKSAFSKIAPKISQGISSLFNSAKSTVSKVISPLKNIGSKVAAGISKLGQTGIGKAVGKVASKVGGFAAKTGKIFGKVLGPVMSLMETGSVLKDAAKKGVANTVEDYKKNWKWTDYLNPSKMAAVGGAWIGDKVGDFMSWYKHKGKTPQQEAAEMLAKKNGTTVEQELEKLKPQSQRIAEAKTKELFTGKPVPLMSEAEKQADKQNLTVMSKENSVVYGDVAKQAAVKAANDQRYKKIAAEERAKVDSDKPMSSVHAKIADEYEKMTEFTGAMQTWSENDDMYAVEINKDLLTNSGQLSEEGILILKRQGVSDQQLQQVQSMMNNSIQNNGSNIVQNNITQRNDAAVYATGDAARTMAM